MKHTSKMLTALLLALLLLTLSACRSTASIPKVNTVAELVGYVNLYLKYPTRRPEVESGKEYPLIDSLSTACQLSALEDEIISNSSIAELGLQADNDTDISELLSQLLEFMVDNIDEVVLTTDYNFPALNSGIESKIAMWEYFDSLNNLLLIMPVLECNCGCDGELWLLSITKDGRVCHIQITS